MSTYNSLTDNGKKRYIELEKQGLSEMEINDILNRESVQIVSQQVTRKEISQDFVRWVNDIGMFATDRPINDVGGFSGSCVHRTTYCNEHCYNVKIYRMYPALHDKDIRCETVWRSLINPDNVQIATNVLDNKRNQTQRVRFNTRGECLKDSSDIIRVQNITAANSNRFFWLPTRSWLNDTMRALVEEILFPIDNLAVLASMDITNTQAQWDMLTTNGWSTMFFGDNDFLVNPSSGKAMFKCPKTWRGIKGHCAMCKAGCFSKVTLGRRVDVHLKEH